MTHRRTLMEGAGSLGITLSDYQVDAFLTYLMELDKWNRKINLTAITDEREIIIKHFLDSLSYTAGFTPVTGLRLLDMGSGAGFPALPIKIAYPELSITLVDSVKKKATFLRHIVRVLKLSGVEVIDSRTDELPESHHASYDVVTARAFANIASALSAGSSFMKRDGSIVLSRGPDETIGERELSSIGASVENKIALTLPYSNYHRVIWVFKKVRAHEEDHHVPRGT
jgi:16S rRNA (guanine527-N7)-methyltransferase